jgi:hypothetical protein
LQTISSVSALFIVNERRKHPLLAPTGNNPDSIRPPQVSSAKSNTCSIPASALQSHQTFKLISTLLDPLGWCVLTLKCTVVMSVNPSSSVGCRYLDAKPVNAILGSKVRFSGLVCSASVSTCAVRSALATRRRACIEGPSPTSQASTPNAAALARVGGVARCGMAWRRYMQR